MITLTGVSKDGTQKLLAIGLCDGNLETLKKIGGLHLTPQTNNLPEGLTIDIIYAPTEEELILQLKQSGLITEKTEVAVTKTPGKNMGLDPNIINGQNRPPTENN